MNRLFYPFKEESVGEAMRMAERTVLNPGFPILKKKAERISGYRWLKRRGYS